MSWPTKIQRQRQRRTVCKLTHYSQPNYLNVYLHVYFCLFVFFSSVIVFFVFFFFSFLVYAPPSASSLHTLNFKVVYLYLCICVLGYLYLCIRVVRKRVLTNKNTKTKTKKMTTTMAMSILDTWDLWDSYSSDNWESEFMTIIVTWQ